MSCHSCGFQDLVITYYLVTLLIHGSYALPLLWLPGPRHYLLFNHVSKLWISMSCHSCGFQDLIITYYLATLVNRGSYALPLLWLPGPHHYLLFSHVSKPWFAHLPSWYLGLFMCFFCHVIMP